MRKIITLTLVFCAASFVSFAKIWRVNNNQGITADFTTLNAAHTGAASGDTIYLESSPTSYGGVNCLKKLTIIGTGYFLDQNQDLQAFTLPSRVDGVSFSAGSEGSSIEGVWTGSNAINIYVNDVVVRRNFFGAANGNVPDYYSGSVGIYNSASNILVTQNCAVRIDNNSGSTGILITNNLLAANGYGGDATNETCINLHSNTVAIVKNNVVRRGRMIVYNCNVTNNIMYKGTFEGSGNLSSNNLGNGEQFGTTDGNKSNVDMTTVFLATGSYDNYWKLKTGSPAIGAGYGSTQQVPVDAGMYGGSTPYVVSGIPAIPSIYFFKNQPVGSNSDPIDVQIKVRSNN